MFATTNGTGPAVLGTVTNTSSGDDPAIFGQNLGSSASGIGVEGSGNHYGLLGASPDIAVRGNGTYVGLWGASVNGFALVGEDSGTGTGIFASSASGSAGYFAGPVIVTGSMTAASYLTSSDRNVKTAIHPVDGKDILARVDQIPVSSWQFKSDSGKDHIGPMAQDFHAAFGLGGDDDRHINLSDANGISLAAIQELSREVNDKDARIAELERKVKSLEDSLSARLAVLEQHDAAMARTAQSTPMISRRNPGD